MAENIEETNLDLQFGCAHEDMLIQVLSKLSFRSKFKYQIISREWHQTLTGLLRRQKYLECYFDGLVDVVNSRSESDTAIRLKSSHFPARYVEMFSRCPNLKGIKFSNIEVSDILLWIIAESCPLIKVLNFTNWYILNDEQMNFTDIANVLPKRFNRLTNLTINCFRVTSAQLSSIILALRQLKQLTVNYLEDITENCFQHMSTTVKSLNLDISYQVISNSAEISAFIGALIDCDVKLDCLRLNNICIYSYLIPKFSRRMISLNELQVTVKALSTPTSLVELGCLRNLQVIELHEEVRSYIMDDQMMLSLMKSCERVTKLKIGCNVNISSVSLNRIHVCWPRIQHLLLELKCVRALLSSMQDNGIDGHTWTAFSKLEHLKSFHITTHSATDTDIVNVMTNCAKLVDLKVFLTFTESMTQKGVNRIINLAKEKSDLFAHINVQNWSKEVIYANPRLLSNNLVFGIRNHR